MATQTSQRPCPASTLYSSSSSSSETWAGKVFCRPVSLDTGSKPAHHLVLQGLPEGVPDPRYVRTGERGQSSGPDPSGRSDSDVHLDMQLECELTDFIGKAPDQVSALDKDIEPHVAQAGLLPQHIGMRQWLLQRPAIFDVDGQCVSLTKQSIEYDRHLETQFVALLQRLGRPAHMSKDIAAYCKKNNIDMRVSLPLDFHVHVCLHVFLCLPGHRCFIAKQTTLALKWRRARLLHSRVNKGSCKCNTYSHLHHTGCNKSSLPLLSCKSK